MKDLYSKYLRNIKNGKTAIKKEYVDRGYFSYYSKREINNHFNSKRILIDGVNSEFNSFVDETIHEIENNIKNDNVLYLGKIDRKFTYKIMRTNSNLNILNNNLVIGKDEIRHALKKHSSKKRIR